MDGSPPGSSVRGIFQARILEWVAISFSRGSSQPRNQTQVSCIAGRFFTNWAMRELQLCCTYIRIHAEMCTYTYTCPHMSSQQLFWPLLVGCLSLHGPCYACHIWQSRHLRDWLGLEAVLELTQVAVGHRSHGPAHRAARDTAAHFLESKVCDREAGQGARCWVFSHKQHVITCTRSHQFHTPGLLQGGRRPHRGTKTGRQAALGSHLGDWLPQAACPTSPHIPRVPSIRVKFSVTRKNEGLGAFRGGPVAKTPRSRGREP